MNSPPLSARPTITSPKKSILKMQRVSLNTEPSHQKYNFSELTNIATIVKDTELQERRNTCNTFLKNKELLEYTQNSKMKNSALFEIKRNFTLDQLSKLQSLTNINWNKKPLCKKGVMLINELWSDRHYKAVVNSSDLKPKTDMIKIQKKIKLFSDMLKDIDIAYKKIKKFNPKEQMDILNTYFNEAATPNELKVPVINNFLRTSASNIQMNSRLKRSHLHPSHLQLNLKNLQNSINNLDFPQNLMNYEKSIVSCSLEDLLQKLQIFAKMESAEKSQELKTIFKKVMHEKMESMDISNEKELQHSRDFRNRMMTHYIHNKHSRLKHSSLVTALQAAHSSPKKKVSKDIDSKNKPSFETIVSETNNLNINMNTFDNNNLCKPIGFRRNLSKKSTIKSESPHPKMRRFNSNEDNNEDDDDDEEEYNIYQFTGFTLPQHKSQTSTPLFSANKNKPKKLSHFEHQTLIPPNKKKEQQPKIKLQNLTNKLITKCDNIKEQNFELFQHINLGLKLKEIDRTKEFKKNRQEKLLEDIEKYIENAQKKIKPDISKKEKETLAIKKMMRSYYVGYDSDDLEMD